LSDDDTREAGHAAGELNAGGVSRASAMRRKTWPSSTADDRAQVWSINAGMEH
jgi:hypothetical protein